MSEKAGPRPEKSEREIHDQMDRIHQKLVERSRKLPGMDSGAGVYVMPGVVINRVETIQHKGPGSIVENVEELKVVSLSKDSDNSNPTFNSSVSTRTKSGATIKMDSTKVAGLEYDGDMTFTDAKSGVNVSTTKHFSGVTKSEGAVGKKGSQGEWSEKKIDAKKDQIVKVAARNAATIRNAVAKAENTEHEKELSNDIDEILSA